MQSSRAIQAHYTRRDIAERILTGLVELGRDPQRLRPEDLEPVDEFHIRRGEATRELAARAGLEPGMNVLDVGCGIGGTCRYLAIEHGCHATGVDLTREYCEVAEMLSMRTGLSERTTFRQADALDLPFDDESFDFVWTEHVQMNIADKERFYREIARVLAPRGRFAFHDIFQGPGGGIHFPVPWAGDASISFLAAPAELEALLVSLGFQVHHWQDVTRASAAWFRTVMERITREGAPPLGIHLLMGEDSPAKVANMVRNLDEDRVAVVQAILDKRAG